MQIDDIAYLDQLYEKATATLDSPVSGGVMAKAIAQDKFIAGVMKLWPEISATFDEHKHSL